MNTQEAGPETIQPPVLEGIAGEEGALGCYNDQERIEVAQAPTSAEPVLVTRGPLPNRPETTEDGARRRYLELARKGGALTIPSARMQGFTSRSRAKTT